MRLPFESLWQKHHVLVPLKTGHSVAIAALHVEGFHRPWSDGEFRSLLAQENVFGFVALVEGRPKAPPAGFILARLAAGEAEILTVAVAKSVRRHGIGQRLVDETLRRLHAERAESLFLEVDGANAAAIKLYRRAGFRKVGERPAYFEGPEGKTAALVMRLDLG
jgi:[ribosomal protein S18]-alanine N-acetyltransferase